MTWTKLGDDWVQQLEAASVSRPARLLLAEMYVWSNRLLTDGKVPRTQVTRLSDSEDTEAELAELVALGVIDVDDDIFTLDWSDQEQGEVVRARKVANAERQKRYRQRRELHERNDHSMCDPNYCRGVTRNTTRDVTTPRSVPARPVPRQGTEAGAVGVTTSPEPAIPVHEYEDDGLGNHDCARCPLPKRNRCHGKKAA